jgi:predicted NBD/HSP70 family sugar kinase
MSEFVFCVDVGGSKILSALISKDGKVVAEELEPTAALDKFDAVLRQIRTAYHTLLGRVEAGPNSRPSAVSLAIAGAIDLEKGVVTDSPNLPQ